MNAVFLKIIAMITMLIDHVGDVFFSDLWFLRTIGRIAFPLYALMVVEGCIYMLKKKDGAKRYLLFLLTLSVLSEWGYDTAFYGSFPYGGSQNQVLQFLTFAVAYGLTAFISQRWFSAVVWVITIVINAYFKIGYNGAGIVFMIMLLYYCKYMKNKNDGIRMLYLFAALTVLFAGVYLEAYYPYYGLKAIIVIWERMLYDSINMGVYLALPFMFRYDFTYGDASPVYKWFYRLFYPLHLTVLAILRILL